MHEAWRVVRAGGGACFLKLNDAAAADVFSAEADGLRALAASGSAVVPSPCEYGVHGTAAFLLLEWLELHGGGDFTALGRCLARLHRREGQAFGWRRDNYIGTAPQENGWLDDWPRFWRERRLAPQLARARAAGFDLAMPDVERVLAGHRPAPSLLHGDLWSGNVAFAPAGPALFDPATYYGDRETDLAMAALFGGFPEAFFAAYDAAWPLEAGHASRRPLYQLYHLLNHLNLFGAAYLPRVQETLRLLAD